MKAAISFVAADIRPLRGTIGLALRRIGSRLGLARCVASNLTPLIKLGKK